MPLQSETRCFSNTLNGILGWVRRESGRGCGRGRKIETCGWQKHRVGWREGGYISQSGALCRGGSSVDSLVFTTDRGFSMPGSRSPGINYRAF
ncbi:hypothetical protein PUN28_005517 [Cardiocondyla obscurior]|uniref:Uncharacterized protein n=1 Tax=Cardiocondyla obscurior TaxID=286306 RepID=A0AAW2GMA4_9HYME